MSVYHFPARITAAALTRLVALDASVQHTSWERTVTCVCSAYFNEFLVI